MLRCVGAAAMAVALVAAPASAACWTAEETSAASIRELQSMLMVAALRCQVVHLDMTADYNAFLKANKALIQRGNGRLKAHFVKASGPAAGQRAYDSFATHLANGFGAEGSSPEVCTAMAALAREAELVAGSEEGLLLLADRAHIVPDTEGGQCGAPRARVAMAAEAATGVAARAPAAAVRSGGKRTSRGDR